MKTTGKIGLMIIMVLLMASCSQDVVMKKKARTQASCSELDGWVVHGRWKWNHRTQTYKWVSGYKSKNRAYWIDGHYASSPKGKKYVPGRWQ